MIPVDISLVESFANWLAATSLSETLNSLSQSMINTAYSAALRPITNHLGGLMSQGFDMMVAGMAPFADGAPFSQGRVMPFAKGGVLSGPVSSSTSRLPGMNCASAFWVLTRRVRCSPDS